MNYFFVPTTKILHICVKTRKFCQILLLTTLRANALYSSQELHENVTVNRHCGVQNQHSIVFFLLNYLRISQHWSVD